MTSWEQASSYPQSYPPSSPRPQACCPWVGAEGAKARVTALCHLPKLDPGLTSREKPAPQKILQPEPQRCAWIKQPGLRVGFLFLWSGSQQGWGQGRHRGVAPGALDRWPPCPPLGSACSPESLQIAPPSQRWPGLGIQKRRLRKYPECPENPVSPQRVGPSHSLTRQGQPRHGSMVGKSPPGSAPLTH